MVHMTLKIDGRYKSKLLSPVVVIVMDQSFPNGIQAVQLMEDINLHEILLVSIFIIPKAPLLWSKNADFWVLLDFEDIFARNWKHGNISDAVPGVVDLLTWWESIYMVWIGGIGSWRVVDHLVNQGDLDPVVYRCC